MFKHEKISLIRITEELKKTFSERLKAVVAFGSRVRGDFHSESEDMQHREFLIMAEKVLTLMTDEQAFN